MCIVAGPRSLMALFDADRSPEDDEILGSDAATRALSVTAVENDFVANVYEKLASVYDLVFGVGTGINAALYPRDCAVTGIDLSSSMLEKAHDRIARKGVRNVRLMQMDAQNMKFADDSFDIVYAPYVISVVPDPVAVTREMYRVCRPGGKIIILNHFRSKSRLGSWLEKIIAPFTLYLGFKSDLDLPAFLVQANLKPVSIKKVNIPRIWSLVTCEKNSK